MARAAAGLLSLACCRWPVVASDIFGIGHFRLKGQGKHDSMGDAEARRSSRRYAVAWGVALEVDSWKNVGRLSTTNVSRGGLFVRSERYVELGTEVAVKLDLPDGRSLELVGVVAHAISTEQARQRGCAPGFGIRFHERHAGELSLLEAMAASYASEAKPPSCEYISVPARIAGPEAFSIETSAHQLVEGGAKRQQEDAEPAALGPAAQLERSNSEEVEVELDVVGTAEHIAIAKGQRPSVDLPLPVTQVPVIRVGDDAVFGIDFGTSFTTIAVVDEDEQLHVLEDEEGQVLLPSVVCYPGKGAPLVGWPAREVQLKHPSATFASPKRLIGRRYNERSIQPLLGSSPVRFSAGPQGKVIAEVYGEPLSIVQVCAEILRRAAQIGSRAAGVPVRRVVISAPVGYDEERAELKMASQLAGLEVVGLVAEPNAAAIAYGLGRQDELAAVYDFGGGTFDFTLVKIRGRRFEVMGQAGDAWLGGDDFDLSLANYAADQLLRERKVDLRQRQVEWQRLLLLAERAKRNLSGQESVELFAKGILLSIRGPVDLRVALDRPLFAEICQDLVERSLSVMDGCLTLAGVERSRIDQVVMVGGVSRIPLVREAVARFFGRELVLSVNPEQAIVMGNAIYARHYALAQRAARGASRQG